ncbi:MAG: IS110 family transposase [Gemmataceae bacterium]|nr:IS110 family transposase [Gemmataceae bacterium]
MFKALEVDLTEIEGIDVATPLVILAEIGVDVSRFSTEKHFASWLGMSADRRWTLLPDSSGLARYQGSPYCHVPVTA